MAQNILTEGKLLNNLGHLLQAGYSTSMVRTYSRKAIKAGALRIKEWDYYYVGNDRYGVALTVADNSYMSLVSASVLDFEKKSYKTTSAMGWFTFGKLDMPGSIDSGNVIYDSPRVAMEMMHLGDTRTLDCRFKNFDNGKDLVCSLELSEFPRDCMVIATPFPGKATAFYYNAKINCMKARGSVYVGNKGYFFDDSTSLGTLDWGRGVWTYSNTWYWSSLSCYIDGVKTGFNLGYGFGDTSKATENMIFYDGIAHKVNNVVFDIPQKNKKDDFMGIWKLTSDDGMVDLTFEPILDRYDNTNVLIISSNQHQVFGKFFGTLTLSDGRKLTLDGNTGFAEKVKNRW